MARLRCPRETRYCLHCQADTEHSHRKFRKPGKPNYRQWVCLVCDRARYLRRPKGLRKERAAWRGARSRCRDSSNHNYGGRGITMCPEWDDEETGFSAFIECLGPVPTRQHTIERVDVDGNYEPGNCVWATGQEQARNRRDTRRYTYNGVTKLVLEWATELGVHPTTIFLRIDQGLPPEDVMHSGRRRRRQATLTHDGRTMTLVEWSRETGVHLATLRRRLRTGWSVGVALDPTNRHGNASPLLTAATRTARGRRRSR